MAAPLQALNQKVRNILGCTNNILDFYGKHCDADVSRDRIRVNRLAKSVKMNRKTIAVAAVAVETDVAAAPSGTSSALRPLPVAIKGKGRTPPHSKPATKKPHPPKKASAPKNGSTKKPSKPSEPSESSEPSKVVEAIQIAPTAATDAIAADGTNLIKIKWKALANVGGVKETETAKLATPWKAVKVPKMPIVMKSVTKGGGGGGGGGSGGGGSQSLIDPVVSSLVQTLMRQRGDRTKKNRDYMPVCKLEQYTDKDRAAAVLLGDTDIKTTLEKQLKSERGRYVMPKESSAQVYLVQADFEIRIGGLATAHQLLDKVSNFKYFSSSFWVFFLLFPCQMFIDKKKWSTC